jgi:cysteinyl-tRNA synthetase
MIEKHLGETIDIHAGGQDLIFPHHENEIAQSECTHGKQFVNYWMHNGYLTVDGVKMSKSLGNFYTIRELLDQHGGEPMRLSLLTAHYRQPVDFSHDNASEQKRRLDRWYRIVGDTAPAENVPASVIDALADDLNTPKAIAALDAFAGEGKAAELKAGANFMGLLMSSQADWFQAFNDEQNSFIDANTSAYQDARANKDFALADKIRDEAQAIGLTIEVGADGIKWRKAD